MPKFHKKGQRTPSKNYTGVKAKNNGTRKGPRNTMPKAARKAPHTSGFETERGPGRPPYEPTKGDRDFVRKLVAYGMTVDQICSLIESRYGNSIKPETLRKYFAMELHIGTELYVTWCADKLTEHIKRGNISATIFALKTRGRWASQVNLADPNGNPIQAPNVIVAFGTEDDDSEDIGKLLEQH